MVTVVWHLVLFAAAFGLPPLAPSWFPDLGATVVDLIARLVPLAVVAAGVGGRSALRLHIGVVWRLGLLHGLDDWMQINSPGRRPGSGNSSSRSASELPRCA